MPSEGLRCCGTCATRPERGTAPLCPEPWPDAPACPLPALGRLEPVMVSFRVTSHWADGIWEKNYFWQLLERLLTRFSPAALSAMRRTYPRSSAEHCPLQRSLETVLIYGT